MPLFTKPQFNNVWASAGAKLTPDVAKISQGWVVEIPPHEFDNWMQNRQDALLAHLNQLGIPQWDSTVEYQAGKSYVQGITTGVVYCAVTTNTNVNPELDIQGNWTVAFQASGQALLKSQNLADVPDKAAARDNLGIATTAFYDGRYLQSGNNLSDVPNKATARNNLGLGNSAILNVGTVAGTIAAGDDSRIVNAVPNSLQVIAGSGLTGGGRLDADRVFNIGTPSHITRTSGNSVTGTTHSHAVDYSSLFPSSWVNVTSSRSNGVGYVNTLGKIMFVNVESNQNQSATSLVVYVNGVVIHNSVIADRDSTTGTSFIVPEGSSYSVSSSNGIRLWAETR